MPRQLGSNRHHRKEAGDDSDVERRCCPVCGGEMHDCEAGYTNCARCNPQQICSTCLMTG